MAAIGNYSIKKLGYTVLDAVHLEAQQLRRGWLRLLTVQQVGLTAVSAAYSYVHDGAVALRFGPSPGRVYEALVNLGATFVEQRWAAFINRTSVVELLRASCFSNSETIASTGSSGFRVFRTIIKSIRFT